MRKPSGMPDINNKFLVLAHYPVTDRTGRVITSAVTTLDLHDFSRLTRTYGLAGFFAQTNLPVQVELMQRLLHHWIEGSGGEYNPDRKNAFGELSFVESIPACKERVRELTGQEPLLFGTSAKAGEGRISFPKARELMEGRPAMIIFGTASGLTDEALELFDYIIEPIGSPSGYNHLSVRSAASIVVDRLFGEGRG